MRAPVATLCLIACALVPAAAGAQPSTGSDGAQPAEWSGEIATYLYFFDDDDPLFMPIGSIDRSSLHLEGRYQYEDRNTVSLWAGWSFEAGTNVHLTVVPMAGAIFGDTDGVAPGLELTLAWRRLEFYSESEYVFDAEGSDGNFAYNWSELRWQLRDPIGVGLSVQRTREHRSERTVDRGLFAAVSRGRFELSFHWFNYEEGSRFAILGLSLGL